MIRLKADSRSKRWSVARTYGQVTDFPDQFMVKDSQPDFVQAPGDVECTAITCADVASDKDDVQYDHQDLFDRIPHDATGAIPQDALSETVNVGLLPVGQTNRIKVFNSYYEAHTGGMDAFDSVRSALMKMNYPVAVWSRWYQNWMNVTILPVGNNPISGHMYTVEGWEIISGEPMLQVEAWLGHKLFMPRETFNKAVSAWGCGTAVLSTLQMDISRKKTIIEKLIDLYKNLYLLITQPSKPMPEPQNEPTTNVSTNKVTIPMWAKAVQNAEGWWKGSVSYIHNNPGNLGFTPLTQSWGAVQGNKKADGGYFAKFSTVDQGFQALCNFLTLGAHDELKAFHSARTLLQFSSVYGNTGPGYGNGIAKELGVSPDTDVSTFLS